MARSLCAKCGTDEFETVEFSPLDSDMKLIFVQCSQCGSVAGVLDYKVGEAIPDIENRIKLIDRRLTNIEYDIDTIRKKRR